MYIVEYQICLLNFSVDSLFDIPAELGPLHWLTKYNIFLKLASQFSFNFSSILYNKTFLLEFQQSNSIKIPQKQALLLHNPLKVFQWLGKQSFYNFYN